VVMFRFRKFWPYQHLTISTDVNRAERMDLKASNDEESMNVELFKLSGYLFHSNFIRCRSAARNKTFHQTFHQNAILNCCFSPMEI